MSEEEETEWDHNHAERDRHVRHPLKVPPIALYAKTKLIEQYNAVLGDGCKTISME